MLKRVAKWDTPLAHSSEESDFEDGDEDPEIRALYEKLLAKAQQMENDREQEEEEESGDESDNDRKTRIAVIKLDDAPFCGASESVTLKDKSVISFDGKKYDCSVCIGKDIWLGKQVTVHIESKVCI